MPIDTQARQFVSYRCAMDDCDVVGTPETGYAHWLVLEAPAFCYVRYFFCPECRLIFKDNEEMRDAERH